MELVLMKDGVWSNYSDLTRPGPPNGGLVREIPENFKILFHLARWSVKEKEGWFFWGGKFLGKKSNHYPLNFDDFVE